MRDSKGRFVKAKNATKEARIPRAECGDIISGKSYLRAGRMEGQVVQVDPPDELTEMHYRIDTGHGRLWLLDSTVRIVRRKSAPQPKAEDPGRVQWLESEIEAKAQEIAALKADAAELRSTNNEAVCEILALECRAKAAEAKLEDIAAVARVGALARKHGVTNSDDIIAAVLGGAA